MKGQIFEMAQHDVLGHIEQNYIVSLLTLAVFLDNEEVSMDSNSNPFITLSLSLSKCCVPQLFIEWIDAMLGSRMINSHIEELQGYTVGRCSITTIMVDSY